MSDTTGDGKTGVTDVEVAIVGAGMVGATLAAALGGAGISVALIDRAAPAGLAAAPYDGRASAVAFGSQRALEGIGVWTGMAPAAEPILDIRVSDGQIDRPDPPLFLHYDHRDLGEDPFGWIVENRAIREALFAQLQGVAAVTLLAPAVLASVEEQPSGIRLGLEDGRAVRARLLVAADGSRSRLRSWAGIGKTEWSYPQTAIVCTMAHEAPHNGVAHERFLPAGPFAVLPMTDGPDGRHRSSIVWTERRHRARGYLALDDPAFSAELGRHFGRWFGAVRVDGARWSYPLRLLHAERYVGPRFALVGDAAHTIHPIAGQGLNLGLRDVAALAEVLVDGRRLGLDVGDLSLLRRYERWRRVDNLALMAVTDGLNRLFSTDFGPVRLLRDLGLAAVNRMAGPKRLLMRHAMGTVGALPRLVRGETL